MIVLMMRKFAGGYRPLYNAVRPHRPLQLQECDGYGSSAKRKLMRVELVTVARRS